MQKSLKLIALLAVGALASPVLNFGGSSKGIAAHQHHRHLEYHLLRARQKVEMRALQGGSESGGGDEGETPAEQMLDELDTLYGESLGQGPSDAWGQQGQAQSQPEVQPQAQGQPQAQAQAQPAQQTPSPPQAEEHVVTITIGASQPSSQPQVQDDSQQQQQQQQQQPQQTEGKPQPTVQEPAPTSTSSNSEVSTDGLPTEFVADLSPESAIYKGLSNLHHDIHRQNHSLNALSWNDTLFEYAKETATSCIYGHSLAPGGGGYGQNIAAGNAPGNISAILTNAYYNDELPLFLEAIGEFGNNSPDMSNFENWGHVTQMLWKDTTSFACYTATCSPPGADAQACDGSGQSYLKNVGCGNGGTPAYNTVCNYYPPGNYANEYSAVPAPADKMPFVQMTEQNGVVGL